MARRRSRSMPRRGRKGSAVRRPRTYDVTCSACGIVLKVPVRPEPGTELTCLACAAKNRPPAT